MNDIAQWQLTSLYTGLVRSFGATKDDRATFIELSSNLANQLAYSLNGIEHWDEQFVARCLSVIVLLDHAGAEESARQLIDRCVLTAADDRVVQARFVSLGLVLDARHGRHRAYRLPKATDLPDGAEARLAVNIELSSRYGISEREGVQFAGSDFGLSTAHQQPIFSGGAIAEFALTSLAFDHLVFAARPSDARLTHGRLEQLAGSIMSELGERHPYLGLVLLTLSSAKCSLAAIESNVQDLRRYGDVLAIAVQRASAQLGPDHVQTVGGMANLAHIEFEIALSSRPPIEVRHCLENLMWLEKRASLACGDTHPTVVILSINTAVAQLEVARQARSVERIQQAESKLRGAARLAEERFGPLHPCTAIARSNAASAGFDIARAQRSRVRLEHMVDVLQDTVSQVSNSLGAAHATARALTQQLRACRLLLDSDDALTGGRTSTTVRTLADEMWGIDDDYVPVYETPSGPYRNPPVPQQIAVNDIGTEEDLSIGPMPEGKHITTQAPTARAGNRKGAMHAVVLAGGKGVRLRPYATRLPKPLVPVGDEFSILDIVLRQLAQHGFDSVTLAIGYLGDLIRSYVGDGSRWGMTIDYSTEEEPLGTVGPVLQVLDRLPEHFVVMSGNVLTDLDYSDLLTQHVTHAAPLTVATYKRHVKVDFGVLNTYQGKIIELTEKPTLDYRVSMGVYGMSRETLTDYPVGIPLGFDELVLDLLARGASPQEYDFNGYWLDISRPDDYDKANAEFDVIRGHLLKGE